MKNVRAFVSFTTLLAAVLLLVCSMPAMAQGPPPQNQASYGFTNWGINGQRVASQFAYTLDTRNGGLGTGLGLFTFPASVCQNLLKQPGRPFGIDPLNANAQVKINDVVAANTETVTGVNPVISGGLCTLSYTTVNSHVQGSYYLTSASCGLSEAINDLGTPGGVVIVDQEFYQLGCSAATITGLTTAFQRANIWIQDISSGQNTWYSLQPSTLSALAVPTTSNNLTCTAVAGLVCQSATVGGTWPNSAEVAGDIYVDFLGGWSVASVTHTLTPSASGTNILQFNSPAASTGAAGWLPWGGLTYNSAAFVLPVTAANCTLSTQFTGYPICAIGSNATMLGPVVTTALIPQSGGIANAANPNPQSHTTFAYRPSQRPGYGFQLNYGPFTACPALTAGQSCVVGTVQLPTGFLQSLGIGGTVRFTFDVTNTPSTGGTAQGIDVSIGDITDFSTGVPLIICNGKGDITASGTAAIIFHEQCDWTINAIGATGSIMPGGFGIEQVAALGTIGNPFAIPATAVTADILDQDAVYFLYKQTSGAETTTPPQMQNLKIEILNN